MQDIKEAIKTKYGKIALTGNSDCCCMPGQCGTPIQAAATLGYSEKDLQAVPQESILGVGCGAPLNHASLEQGEVVVDLGSGAGIDVFMSANRVGKSGRVIGIDMTEEMLAKARKNAAGFDNVEFRRGDIEERIPLEDAAADVVISNCVINLTADKVAAFKEIRRILRDGGRMVISDLVTDRESENIDSEKWSSCIDGALTKENYISCISKAGFVDIKVLKERPYIEVDGRRISSVVVRAVK
ncbi:MAG: protein-L-isoaspartate(D-aspartate) O-methyltransferase [Nitrososphaera sp.]|nr:protein-L-isoaspartate(D-aspartate) O-methyltransferase [Nitrososphaera sp.]